MILVHHARACGGLPPLGPHSKGEERRGTVRVAGGGVVWRLVALATVGGDPPIVLSGGRRIKQQEDKHKHWDPTQEKSEAHAHRPARAHGEKGARSPLCCRFTWGVWLVVVVGRQTRVWVATYVRVSTIGRYRLKYLCCLRQCSSQAHMCEILP